MTKKECFNQVHDLNKLVGDEYGGKARIARFLGISQALVTTYLKFNKFEDYQEHNRKNWQKRQEQENDDGASYIKSEVIKLLKQCIELLEE